MIGNDLDGPVPYLPSTGPEVNRILKEIYGVDLFDPPNEIRKARPGGSRPSQEEDALTGVLCRKLKTFELAK